MSAATVQCRKIYGDGGQELSQCGRAGLVMSDSEAEDERPGQVEGSQNPARQLPPSDQNLKCNPTITSSNSPHFNLAELAATFASR